MSWFELVSDRALAPCQVTHCEENGTFKLLCICAKAETVDPFVGFCS